MKQAVAVLGAWLVVLSAATVAEAFDAGGVKVTATVKTWYNAWEEKDEDSAGTTDTRDFGSALMAGPSVTVRLDKVLLGASYLWSLQGYEPESEGSGEPITYDRRDLDLTATYMFVPRFGAFVGYKSIDSPISISSTGEDYGSMEFKGPGLGITGNIPIGTAAALYGSLAVLRLNKDYATNDKEFSFDMTGASMDLGVAFAFNARVSASAGVKGQYFSGDDDSGQSHSSTFTGLTVGVNFSF